MPAVTPARFKGWFSKGWSAVCPPYPNHAPALPRQPTKCAGKCAGRELRPRLHSPSAQPVLSPAGVCCTTGGAGSPEATRKQGLSRPPWPKNYIYVSGGAWGGFSQCAPCAQNADESYPRDWHVRDSPPRPNFQRRIRKNKPRELAEQP